MRWTPFPAMGLHQSLDVIDGDDDQTVLDSGAPLQHFRGPEQQQVQTAKPMFRGCATAGSTRLRPSKQVYYGGYFSTPPQAGAGRILIRH
jgi:hypothetical protein